MNITSYIKELLGLETVIEQPFLFEINENRQQNPPNLGKGFTTSDDTNSSESKVERYQQGLSPFVSKVKAPKVSPTIPATYNLIILDESGSMRSVREDVVSGCNKLLQSIRETARKMVEIKQYVSIFCFDTSRSRYIFYNESSENTRKLTMADYYPNAYTPLYDAIGHTVTQFDELIDNNKSVGVVTIITDGHENASHQWNYHMVIDLIYQKKRRGWVFSLISADIDVETIATDLGIDNYLKFEKTKESIEKMFEKKRLSDQAYNAKRCYVERMRFSGCLPEEECKIVYEKMNNNYFISEERIAPDVIHQLAEDEIFVFASDIQGLHKGKTSLMALEHFGAIKGQAEGIQGQSYAIPIIGNSNDKLKTAIERFNEYVVIHPEKKFILSGTRCEATGYIVEQEAKQFRQAYSFGNVYIPREYLKYMN